MSEGAYLLERIRLQSVEEGDCLIWQGGCTGDGNRPRVYMDGKPVPLRRALFMDFGPTKLKPGERVGVKCGTHLCVAPEHLAPRSRSKELKGIKRSTATKAKIANARRAQTGFTTEFVEMVRNSPKSHLELSKELGMHHQTIQKWRTHARRQNYVTPFSGLGARP